MRDGNSGPINYQKSTTPGDDAGGKSIRLEAP
jgi:hypothetical protein